MNVLGEFWPHLIANGVVGFLGGCLAASIIFVSLPRVFPPASTTLATVDASSLVQSFVKAEAARSASMVQHHAHVRAFSQQLERAVQVVAQEQRVVILPKEAVIAGAVKDITPQVAQQLSAGPSADTLPTEASEQ
jgi:Type-F conjugative transfer system protein (TrbI_Ftype)